MVSFDVVLQRVPVLVKFLAVRTGDGCLLARVDILHVAVVVPRYYILVASLAVYLPYNKGQIYFGRKNLFLQEKLSVKLV